MLKKIRTRLIKSNNTGRDAYLWNTLTGIISAAESPLILMVITRTSGLNDAGVFSIAYAVASLMIFIGQYGLRRFQSSDVTEQYLFSDYFGMRIITCGIMLFASLGYCIFGVFFNDYTVEKFVVIFLICAWKCIQAFADVIHGRLQQRSRLDIAGKASCARMVTGTLTYMIMLAVTQNLIISTIACIIVSFIAFLLTTMNVAVDFCKLSPSFDKLKLKALAIAGFPLFCSYFLSMYISNAPKYAIDAYLSNEVQAYYNFIFMPAFAVGLLANFIFNPILTSYAKIWAKGEFRTFKKLVAKQIGVIAGITVVGLIGAYFLGTPILSLIFGADLSGYRIELCVVMIGGGMLAYVTFFTTVITIIRYQNALLFGYLGISICAKLLSRFFVVNYGIMGAAVLYSILMGVLAITFFVILVFKVHSDISKKHVK